MRVLVVGASGATGQLVINQLLSKGVGVSAIIHSIDSLPDRQNLTKIPILANDITSSQMAMYIKGCDVIVSCLGHRPTFNGIFGSPRSFVTDTLTKICEAITFNADTGENYPVKVISLNSVNYNNRDAAERAPLMQCVIMPVLRFLSPPHFDNQTAADFLRTRIGQNEKAIEWVVIRPSPLINDKHISKYKVFVSPIRSSVNTINSVSKINVADFITELAINTDTWQTWKGKMPVLYNQV